MFDFYAFLNQWPDNLWELVIFWELKGVLYCFVLYTQAFASEYLRSVLDNCSLSFDGDSYSLRFDADSYSLKFGGDSLQSEVWWRQLESKVW